jgi:hypothetical protein
MIVQISKKYPQLAYRNKDYEKICYFSEGKLKVFQESWDRNISGFLLLHCFI